MGLPWFFIWSHVTVIFSPSSSCPPTISSLFEDTSPLSRTLLLNSENGMGCRLSSCWHSIEQNAQPRLSSSHADTAPRAKGLSHAVHHATLTVGVGSYLCFSAAQPALPRKPFMSAATLFRKAPTLLTGWPCARYLSMTSPSLSSMARSSQCSSTMPDNRCVCDGDSVCCVLVAWFFNSVLFANVRRPFHHRLFAALLNTARCSPLGSGQDFLVRVGPQVVGNAFDLS